MRITVHDTLTQTRNLLTLPVADRPAALLELLAPVLPMYAYAPAGPVDSHHLGHGFRVDADRGNALTLDTLYVDALDRLERVDAWGQVQRCLTEAYDHQAAATPGFKTPDELQVILLLGDPSDEFFLNTTGGYYGVGGFPGYLTVTVWPTDANEYKIGYCAAHELHHNLRFSTVEWNPATVTVGDQVICEGLAEAFVRELYGPEAMGPWGDPARGDEAAYQKVVESLGIQGMQHLAAYVHGDVTARRMGVEPVGLPTGVGYLAGIRLVDAHLAATGLTVAQSSLLAADEIIRHALASH
jgi:uncharacterized protein YjaZ